jgi:6-phosphogluconolactonase
MSPPKIQVAADPQALAVTVAEHVVRSAQESLRLTGHFAIALSGGKSPRLLYQTLADVAHASRIDWASVDVFFSDERCVPPDSTESNFRQATELLLDHVPVAYERIFRLRGEADPHQAADEYDQLLRSRFPENGLDLALLGVGDDGHTASLFPGTEALVETKRLCVANYVPGRSVWRLTMTPAFLNRSYEVLVIASGSAKAAVVQRALEGGNASEYPVQLIRPASAKLFWFLDAAAAGMDK